MKTLTLLRHAKSSWDDPAQSDFDRPLNERGRKAARAMGREMRRLGLSYDLILASPAVAGDRDAERAGAGLWRRGRHGSGRAHLSRLARHLARRWSAPPTTSTASLLLAGHNPGLALLALRLGRAGGLHDLIAAKYPTGALTEIALRRKAVARRRGRHGRARPLHPPARSRFGLEKGTPRRRR